MCDTTLTVRTTFKKNFSSEISTVFKGVHEQAVYSLVDLKLYHLYRISLAYRRYFHKTFKFPVRTMQVFARQSQITSDH